MSHGTYVTAGPTRGTPKVQGIGVRWIRPRTSRYSRKSAAATPAYQMSGFGTLEITEMQWSVPQEASSPTHMAVGRTSSGHCHAGLAYGCPVVRPTWNPEMLWW